MSNEFVIRNGAQVSSSLSVTGSTNITGSSDVLNAQAGAGGSAPVFNVFGTAGQLFTVTDGLEGSLFSVNTISGLPIMEAFSTGIINLGAYTSPALVVSGSKVSKIDYSGSLILSGSILGTNTSYISIGTTSSVARINAYGTTNVVSVYGSTSEGVMFDVNGPSGQLFSVVDGLSGSLFSVNTISGLPIMEAFSDATIRMGNYGAPALVITGSTASITGSLFGTASLATTALTASYVNPLTQSVLIRGLGTTSATTSLLVQNSAGTDALQVRDDGLTLAKNKLYVSSTGVNYGLTVDHFTINGGGGGVTLVRGNSKIGLDGSELINLLGHGGKYQTYQVNQFGSTANSIAFRWQTSESPTNWNTYVTRMQMLANGNLGLGVTSPSASLHISASASASAALSAYKSGSTVLDIQGSQGQLFSVVDSLTGSLMSVNDVSGLPILEVFSDDRVVMGTYGAPALIITGSVANVTGSLVVQGQTMDPALIWFLS